MYFYVHSCMKLWQNKNDHKSPNQEYKTNYRQLQASRLDYLGDTNRPPTVIFPGRRKYCTQGKFQYTEGHSDNTALKFYF